MKKESNRYVEDKLLNIGEMNEGKGGVALKVAIFIILAILLSLFVGRNQQDQLARMYGYGNPYNCENCKNLGRACREHRNFDKEQALRDKIYKLIDRYDPDSLDENQSLYAMYGYGNLYNTECDFCSKEEKECYSCKYDREYILNIYNSMLNSESFIDTLCNDCYIKGKPECDICKEMAVNFVYDNISSNN